MRKRLTSLVSVLVATSLVCSSIQAQDPEEDTRVVLKHIPKGFVVQLIPGIDGGPFMVYDLEGFKQLAEVDVQLTESLRQIGLLEKELTFNAQELEMTQLLLLSTSKDLKKAKDLLDQVPDLSVPPLAEADNWLWTWQHLLIESILVIAVGGLAYAYIASP